MAINSEKIYQSLRKKYTDEEIADSMLIPADLTEEERQQADEELRQFRFELLKNRTEKERIFSDLLRFRYQIEHYLENDFYNEDYSFGKQLEEYARILKRTKKQLSEDLDIHYTRLSRIINNREDPNTELAYRLEKHSGDLIPALTWWKLVSRKQEYFISKDQKTRKREAARVRNAMKFSA